MIAWTTSHVKIRVPVNLAGAKVLVSIKQQPSYATDPVVIEDASPSVTAGETESVVEAAFSQEQTGRLSKGCAKLQCNWLLPDGNRGAITAVDLSISENLKSEVMTNG